MIIWGTMDHAEEGNNKDLEKSQVYELGYHLLQTVGEVDLGKEVGVLHKTITDESGNIISESFPELRGLSYEISKKVETKYVHFNKALFGWIKFEVLASRISNIEKRLKTNPNILRFVVIKTMKENTLYTPKMVVIKRENTDNGPLVSGTTEDLGKVPASQEEIDKSIEELVIN